MRKLHCEGAAQDSKEEVELMKHGINLLQKGLWSMFGYGGGTMTMDELHALEKNLESYIYHIRSAKMNILFQEIQILKNKEGALKAANKHLQEKMKEQIGVFDYGLTVANNIPYPLTIHNEIFQY
ncbi:hypothetical protein Droror1_Dr00011422 [Drosera rotundifolia]